MNTPRIMIAGTGSTCGKTTVTCAILKALHIMNKKTASFKCGPDYIDPMFHTYALGSKSRNLDLFMMGEQNLKYLLKENSKSADISVLEGVMGFYDGVGTTSEYSGCNISNITQTPVILVVNCKGMAVSTAAIIKGFLEFEKNNIKGVILNHISSSMYSYYKSIVEEHTDVKVMGYLPYNEEFSLESRHLGLITPSEVESISRKIELLGQTAIQTIDFEGIFSIANSSSPITSSPPNIPMLSSNIKIAVAKDKAFCFYYEDNLELLRRLGAEIIEFSPLSDEALPEGISGIILGGGYPELYAKELSENKKMLLSISKAIDSGIPTIAECGGFIYLTKSISIKNHAFDMAGVVDSSVFLTNKLNRFGYITITANEDNLLCKKGDSINCHEFHYSDATQCGDSFNAVKPTGRSYPCVFATDTLFAGYPHLHFYGNMDFAISFVKKCCEYSKILKK